MYGSPVVLVVLVVRIEVSSALLSSNVVVSALVVASDVLSIDEASEMWC